MYLQDLFEKNETSDIELKDPTAKYLLDKARAKYSYADTDLEAFIQLMRDEVEDEKSRIEKNQKEIERNKKELNRTDNRLDRDEEDIQSNTDGVERETSVNQNQQGQIKSQAAKDKEHDQAIARLKDKEDKIDSQIDRLSQSNSEMNRVKDVVTSELTSIKQMLKQMDRVSLELNRKLGKISRKE